MLAVQEYLRSGKSVADLKEELAISCYRHPTLPLVGFSYSQIDSPKTHPVVRDCRGVVLEDGSWNLVAKPFRRFFNAGEDADNFRKFAWHDCSATSKEDGSLIILYFFQSEWHVNTSGSFGLGEAGFSGKSWRELFWSVSGIDRRSLDPEITYLFELWTPFNKVVRTYPRSNVWLLSAFHAPTLREAAIDEADGFAKEIGVTRPDHFQFNSLEAVLDFLRVRSEQDRTFEGVVIRDIHNERWKVKSETYVALHHLFDNGNIFNPRRLVPLVLAGEVAEVSAYFPDAAEHLEKVKDTVDAEWQQLVAIWRNTWAIEGQKDFALAIVKKTPFSGILFDLRKKFGKLQTEEQLAALWRQSGESIIKHLYGN